MSLHSVQPKIESLETPETLKMPETQHMET
jgi:hypothetical protein